MPVLRRPRLRAMSVAAVAAATAIALAGCSTHGAPPISAYDLWIARQFKHFTVYWAGRKVDGVPLTAADNLSDFVSASVGFALYYGNCGGRGTFHTGGCSLPLKITTTLYSPHSDAAFGPLRWVHFHGVPAVVYHGGQNIELYTFHEAVEIVANSPRLAYDAALALWPFNRAVSVDFPAFPQPLYQPGLSRQELEATGPSGATGASGASGATGATGATSSIAPPPGLEPAPSAS